MSFIPRVRYKLPATEMTAATRAASVGRGKRVGDSGMVAARSAGDERIRSIIQTATGGQNQLAAERTRLRLRISRHGGVDQLGHLAPRTRLRNLGAQDWRGDGQPVHHFGD